MTCLQIAIAIAEGIFTDRVLYRIVDDPAARLRSERHDRYPLAVVTQ